MAHVGQKFALARLAASAASLAKRMRLRRRSSRAGPPPRPRPAPCSLPRQQAGPLLRLRCVFVASWLMPTRPTTTPAPSAGGAFVVSSHFLCPAASISSSSRLSRALPLASRSVRRRRTARRAPAADSRSRFCPGLLPGPWPPACEPWRRSPSRPAPRVLDEDVVGQVIHQAPAGCAPASSSPPFVLLMSWTKALNTYARRAAPA